ncbi:MAG: caspase family protein [Planctomycetes bacterium]|nr:caspase family protein [Planctomycetota bacterium]
MFAFINLRRFVLSLCLVAAFTFAMPHAHGNPNDTPTVHLVAIGDTDVGGDFGRKLGEDARNIKTTFEKAFARANRSSQLKTHLLLGQSVTPANILKVIGQLKVGRNDTIVVLYSGHGATDPRLGHVLTLDHGRLYRKDLLNALKAKNPRLMVVLTDCCSSGVPARAVVNTYTPRPLASGQVMQWSTVQSLFLRHQGLVDITAAEPGYCGKIDLQKSGSLFTNALTKILTAPNASLVSNLDKDGDGQMQWDEILPQLRAQAAQYDRNQMRTRDVRPQQAYATSLGRWIPMTSPTAR